MPSNRRKTNNRRKYRKTRRTRRNNKTKKIKGGVADDPKITMKIIQEPCYRYYKKYMGDHDDDLIVFRGNSKKSDGGGPWGSFGSFGSPVSFVSSINVTTGFHSNFNYIYKDYDTRTEYITMQIQFTIPKTNLPLFLKNLYFSTKLEVVDKNINKKYTVLKKHKLLSLDDILLSLNNFKKNKTLIHFNLHGMGIQNIKDYRNITLIKPPDSSYKNFYEYINIKCNPNYSCKIQTTIYNDFIKDDKDGIYLLYNFEEIKEEVEFKKEVITENEKTPNLSITNKLKNIIPDLGLINGLKKMMNNKYYLYTDLNPDDTINIELITAKMYFDSYTEDNNNVIFTVNSLKIIEDDMLQKNKAEYEKGHAKLIEKHTNNPKVKKIKISDYEPYYTLTPEQRKEIEEFSELYKEKPLNTI